MAAYLVRRLGSGVIILVLVSMITFAGVALAPGDPLTAEIPADVLAQLTPHEIQQKRDALGLNQPIPVRYVKWVKGVVSGNLGYSTSDQMAVAKDLGEHIGPTLLLVSASLLLAIIVALPLGIIAALREHKASDYVLSAIPATLIGIPSFVLGLACIDAFAVHFRVFPTGGLHTLGDDSAGDLLWHLVLPAIILSILVAAPLLRYTRTAMLDALKGDYLVTARSKGLSPWTVVIRHAFRNALLPVITVIGVVIPQLITGDVIVEDVFDWPGLGQLAVHAASNRDLSVTLAVVLVVGGVVVVVNILTDLVYAAVDPRVRLA